LSDRSKERTVTKVALLVAVWGPIGACGSSALPGTGTETDEATSIGSIFDEVDFTLFDAKYATSPGPSPGYVVGLQCALGSAGGTCVINVDDTRPNSGYPSGNADLVRIEKQCSPAWVTFCASGAPVPVDCIGDLHFKPSDQGTGGGAFSYSFRWDGSNSEQQVLELRADDTYSGPWDSVFPVVCSN